MSLIDNKSKTLQDALKNTLPSSDRVDILTAYFYFSGFSALVNELKDKKIRILIGKSIDPKAVDELISAMNAGTDMGLDAYQNRSINQSRSQRKAEYIDSFVRLYNKTSLFDTTEDQTMQKVFEGKLRDGSLEIRMTSEPNHAKAYILTNKPEFAQGGDYKGNVFMGSSNFTHSGLSGQGELNTVSRDNATYDEYSGHFENLWKDGSSIDIQTEESNNEFLQEIQKKLWIHATPNPYKIYVRVLHELYAKVEDEDVSSPDSITGGKFKNLKYQLDAIREGMDCIDKNNGVIVADVVGLGKSVIASAIAHNLDMTTVIIAPPLLKTQWEDYVGRFRIPGAIVESSGKIKHLHDRYAKYGQPVLYILDEAHRYRNELTDDYQLLHQLTRSHIDNKVMLLTATPYNNRPQDLFALVKLFQTPSRSTINSVDNLGLRFHDLIAEYRKLEKVGKKNMTVEIEEKLKKLSQELRLLIDPVVIRRSRIDLKEIKEYADDLKTQGISFPDINGPNLIQYDLGNMRDLYIATLLKITDNDNGFNGARYQSAQYIKDVNGFRVEYGAFFDDTDLRVAQSNLAQFMKRLLVMRFESSKYAFRSTLGKMIKSHESFIKWWDEGYVPIQKKGDLLDPDELEDFDDIDDIMGKINDGEEVDIDKAKRNALLIPKVLFEEEFILKVKNDRDLLRSIEHEWFANNETGEDPKQRQVELEIQKLQSENPKRKLVIFSGYADTAEWVYKNLKEHGFSRTFLYTGGSTASDKNIVSKNFDASWPEQENDYDIIVATDALSEGFNLHRAGVVINYDIPYNPTRVVQRIGRINRINEKVFDEIFIYNFFPTDVGEDVANIKGISTLKMLLINNIVGSDTRTLTPDEDLQSYFKKSYDDANSEENERSWDNEYRNDYNSVKHNLELLREIMEIPERTRIVREDRPEAVSISFAKRGNGTLFALAPQHDTEAEIVTPELVLGYFKANQDEKSREGDSDLDKKFEILRERITAPHPVPKVEGRRADAIKIIDYLKESYAPERDYLHDLFDAIKDYDDLSDGELKYISQLRLTEDSLVNAIAELKQKFPVHYINVIKEKAEAIDKVSEIIMFTEDLRR